MRLRTVALALALACGFTATTMEARPKVSSHFRKSKRSKSKVARNRVPKHKARKIKHRA